MSRSNAIVSLGPESHGKHDDDGRKNKFTDGEKKQQLGCAQETNRTPSREKFVWGNGKWENGGIFERGEVAGSVLEKPRNGTNHKFFFLYPSDPPQSYFSVGERN